TVLHSGDILLLDLVRDGDEPLSLREPGLRRLSDRRSVLGKYGREIGLAEALIPPESVLAGSSLAEARFRSDTGLTGLGLKRGRKALDGNIANHRLQPGDTLLLAGSWKA